MDSKSNSCCVFGATEPCLSEVNRQISQAERLRAELGNMPQKMVCHKECARQMKSSLDDIVIKQTHVLTINTYTFDFNCVPVLESQKVPAPSREVKKRFSCHICSKRFKYQKNLLTHSELHAFDETTLA